MMSEENAFDTIIIPNDETAELIYRGLYRLQVRYMPDPDVDYLYHTVRRILEKLPNGVNVCITLKSKFCDHNIVPYAQALKDVHPRIRYFAVQTIEEAVRIRLSGARQQIMLFYAHPYEYFPLFERFGIEPSLGGCGKNIKFRLPRKLRCHLWIDTGMGRDGYALDELKKIDLDCIKGQLTGIATHLGGVPYRKRNGKIDPLVPYFDEEFTQTQHQRFEAARKVLELGGIKPQFIHAAASPALQNDLQQFYYNLVRTGRLITDCPHQKKNRKVLVFKCAVRRTKLLATKEIPKGWYLGYTSSKPLGKPAMVGILSASDVRYLGLKTRVFYKTNRNEVYDLPVLLSHGSCTVVDITNVPVEEGDYVDLNDPDGFSFEIYVPLSSGFKGEIFDPIRNDVISVN